MLEAIIIDFAIFSEGTAVLEMKKWKQKGQEHCWRHPNKFYKGVKVEMIKLNLTKDCY